MIKQKEENTATLENGMHISCLCGKHDTDSRCWVHLKNKRTANQVISLTYGFQKTKFVHMKWWHKFIPKHRKDLEFLNRVYAPVIDEMFLRGELK